MPLLQSPPKRRRRTSHDSGACGGQGREQTLSPAVRKMVAENKIDAAAIAGTGKDGRVTKGDVIAASGKARCGHQAPGHSRGTGTCGERAIRAVGGRT